MFLSLFPLLDVHTREAVANRTSVCWTSCNTSILSLLVALLKSDQIILIDKISQRKNNDWKSYPKAAEIARGATKCTVPLISERTVHPCVRTSGVCVCVHVSVYEREHAHYQATRLPSTGHHIVRLTSKIGHHPVASLYNKSEKKINQSILDAPPRNQFLEPNKTSIHT